MPLKAKRKGFHASLSYLGVRVLIFSGVYLWRQTLLLRRSVVGDHEATLPLPTDERLRAKTFFMLPVPELTTYLLGNFSSEATEFYNSTLNEEQAEIWLHRGASELPQRTSNQSEADVVLIPAYLHLNHHLTKLYGIKDEATSKLDNHQIPHVPLATSWLVESVTSRITMKTKPHVLLIPTWNPGVSRAIGLGRLITSLRQKSGVNLYSVGFERNEYWQHLPADRIIPVPYVIKSTSTLQGKRRNERRKNSNAVFYVGDSRRRAVEWAGCNRTALIAPLIDYSNSNSSTFVKILDKGNSRMPEFEYNKRLISSEYCLILCGDTPSSRSLTASMASGCIPIIIGSRLRGQCDPPCHPGWGWTVSNQTHLPFSSRIDWAAFPELDEGQFLKDPAASLALLKEQFSTKKEYAQQEMLKSQEAWLYGYGDPVVSSNFGAATSWMWESATTLCHI